MDFIEAFRIAFHITIVAVVFATGLATTTADLAYLAHRPGLLCRSLLATVIIAPIVAVLLFRLLPIGAATAIAIIAGSLAPGLPTVPRTGEKAGGNFAFATSLMFTTTSLAVITIPIWLAVLRHFVNIDVAVSLGSIAKLLATGLLLPLVVGVAVRRFAARFATRIAGPVGAFANALLPGLALVVLLVGLGALRELGWISFVVMIVVPLISLLVGHALGGPEPRDRTVLGIANAGRFPALAALIATTSFPEIHALPAVIAYFVIANLVVLPYTHARRSAQYTHKERAPEVHAAAPPAPA
jgi:BASS family bile acid:Na+ symporter